MPKDTKATADTEDRDSAGQHGGNRSGDDDKNKAKSSQPAGKDPHRGKPATSG